MTCNVSCHQSVWMETDAVRRLISMFSRTHLMNEVTVNCDLYTVDLATCAMFLIFGLLII